MKGGADNPSTPLDRGFRRLMLTVGMVLMSTATVELAVQLHYEERPHIVLLGGFFLVGVLAVSHALARRPAPAGRASSCGSRSAPGRAPGQAVWPTDGVQ